VKKIEEKSRGEILKGEEPVFLVTGDKREIEFLFFALSDAVGDRWF
jgi:hypothetical protein